MILLARLIGIFLVCVGIVNFINPVVMKKMISFWQKGKRIYAGGLIRVLFGSVLLWASFDFQMKHPCVLAFLGALMVLGGLLIFILGLERMKTMLNWWDKKPLFVLRLMAILALAIGVLVIYSA